MAEGGAMTIEQDRVDLTTVALILSGRLDAANAPLLEQKIKQWGNDITELILDFSGLTYISSVGLRVLLQAKKLFRRDNRKLTIKNMNETVREVFEMTGFLKLIVQEEQFLLINKNESGSIVLSFNGMMQPDHVATVTKELTDIKNTGLYWETPVTIIFDMANLASVAPRVCKMLKETVDETGWEKRRIAIRNVPPNILSELEKEGLGDLVDR
jgi:anti-sigma B factor antagonist